MSGTWAADGALGVVIAVHRMESYLRTRENAVLKDYGITPMQLGVLDTLLQNGDMKIQALIDAMSSTSGNMTVVVRNLERGGYVLREPVPGDRRCCLIRLSAKGRSLLEKIMPAHRQNMADALRAMPEDDRSALVRIIGAYLDGRKDTSCPT